MSLREQVAQQAFVWGLPAVTLYAVLHEQVLAPAHNGLAGRLNRVLHGPLPTGLATLSGTTGPSTFCAWLDLRSGPVHLIVPAVEPRDATVRATVFDLSGEVVGQVPEALDTPGHPSVVVGPSWDSPVSPEVAAILRCRTDLCVAVGVSVDPGRQAQGPQGAPPAGEPVLIHHVGSTTRAPSPLPPPVPPVDVRRPPTVEFLTVLDWMIELMPTTPGEEDLRADLELVGVACGRSALVEAMAEDRLDGQLTEGLRQGFEDVRRGRGRWF
ncbi:DUF1254 domain-containing protein [Pedococcus sp. KACC 23699]|uniref:DUF1254 domain-containing protein n=1 Tax=Pedococcus sp. KACC 23699 TaxID=3149228 RepID=A0AAU7JSE4_9MICO